MVSVAKFSSEDSTVKNSVPGLAEECMANLSLSLPIIANSCHVVDVFMLIGATDKSKVVALMQLQ